MADPVRDSRRIDALRTSDVDGHGLYIFAGAGSEPRGRLSAWDELLARDPNRCLEVVSQEADSVRVRRGSTFETLVLQDEVALGDLLATGAPPCIDISGLGHQVWAPLVKAAYSRKLPVTVVYAEPEKYRPHSSPAYPDLFDLSESFAGYAPLPGFARLADPPDDTPIALVALLGFEGMRPTRLALEIEPQPKVISIVGVPGFRAEYPTFTVACNGDFLAGFQAQREVRFAAAYCPCEAYETIVRIREDFPDHYLYIAPVGTKPHALGAVCYAILNSQHSELMYDHPKRRPKRTEGIGPVHLYSLRLGL